MNMKKKNRRRPLGVAALLTAAAFLIVPGAAIADLEPADNHFEPTLDITTDPPLAGVPTRLGLQLNLPRDNGKAHQMKSMFLSMEAGRFPDPHVPYCSKVELDRFKDELRGWAGGDIPDFCPQSKVGDMEAGAIVSMTVGGEIVHKYTRAYASLVNVEPKPGYQGRVLIVLRYIVISGLPDYAIQPPADMDIMDSPNVIPIDVRVREESDFGLDTEVTKIPNEINLTLAGDEPVPFRMIDTNIVIDGTRGVDRLNPFNNHPFMSNPSTCGDHHISGTATSYMGHTKNVSTTVTIGGCHRLDFSPELEVSVNPPVPSNTSELLVVLRQSPLGEAHMRSAKVTLPVGINILSSVKPCPRAAADSAACPDESKIGEAQANAQALFEPLTGGIYLVEPDASGKLGLLLTMRGLVNLNLRSPVKLDVAGGTVTTDFTKMPQLPVTEVRLRIYGGKNSLLKTPKCGDHPVKAHFSSHSGLLYKSSSSLHIPCGPSIKEGPLKPRVSVKYLGNGDLRVYVVARDGARLAKATAYLGGVVKSKALEKTSNRRRLVGRLVGKRPKKARFSVSRKGTVSVRAPSSSGASKISFTMPRSYLIRHRSCKKRSAKVKTGYTDGTKHSFKRKFKPVKGKNCNRRSGRSKR